MLTFVQENSSKRKAINSFKSLRILLAGISTLLSQLSRGLAILQFHEGYLKEGTVEDRAYVEDKIKKLQPLINQLDKVKSLFDLKESIPHAEIQMELNLSTVNLKAIRGNMLDIWSMRNKGGTEKDNKKIQDLINLLFKNINLLLGQILTYVTEYNRINETKLAFKVKWGKLPE